MRTFVAVAILCVVLGTAAWAGLSRATVKSALVGTPKGSPTAVVERFQGGTAKPLPAFSFVDGEGRRTELSDFAGRFVLLNVWATWCAPCVREMPSLDRLQAELGGKDFQVLALSVDRGGRTVVEPFLKKHELQNLALYLDPPGAVLDALGSREVPATLLLDPDGREVGRILGAVEWDSPEIVAFLRKQITRGGPSRDRGGMVKTGG